MTRLALEASVRSLTPLNYFQTTTSSTKCMTTLGVEVELKPHHRQDLIEISSIYFQLR